MHFCAAQLQIDWVRFYFGNSLLRVCAAQSRAGSWLHGSACFDNANKAEFVRRNGFDIDQTGCEKAKVNAATITRQSKSNLALAFVSLGRERKRDITIFYAFCRVRSEEHTSELQSLTNLVCRLLLEKKKRDTTITRF